MNKLWITIILACMFTLLFVNPTTIFPTLLSASKKAIDLEVSLCATYAVLLGFFEILSHTKLPSVFSKILSPVINLIYGKNTLTNESKQLVSMSMASNIMGLGSVSTPMSIKAVESMSGKLTKANFAIVMFVVVNATGLQIIPTTVIGILSGLGDSNPAKVILPTLISSLVSTIVGILLVKIFVKRENL